MEETATSMMLVTLMLMNMQKGRVYKRNRQHEVHEHGNGRSHIFMVDRRTLDIAPPPNAVSEVEPFN